MARDAGYDDAGFCTLLASHRTAATVYSRPHCSGDTTHGDRSAQRGLFLDLHDETKREGVIGIMMKETMQPIFRVTTFGRFTLERLVSTPEAAELRYEPITERQWRGRSVARSLLKLLLCRTRRRAPREVLIEALWPDSSYNVDHCFDSALSILRIILRPTGKSESLLKTVSTGGAILYELPSQQQLWTDFEECNRLLVEAEQIESQGQDPLSILEEAQQLIQGEFLEEERYSDWAQLRRDSVNATRRRLWHRLTDLYLQRNKFGQAEALLFVALEHEPTDEDALCRLLLLLHQQGRRHEALRLYESHINILREEYAAEPSPYTRTLAEHLRHEATSLEPLPLVALWHGWLQDALMHGAIPLYPHHMGAQPERQVEGKETMIRFGPDSQPMLSRREIVAAMTGLVGSSALAIPLSITTRKDEEQLSHCAATLDRCWQALKGDGLPIVERTLPQCLFTLQTFLQKLPKRQKEVSGLLSHGYQLAGIVAFHRNDLVSREQYNRLAVFYARLAEDCNILLAALMRLACTFHAAKQPVKALHVYQEAQRYSNAVNPLFTGRLYAGLASAHAQCGHKPEAEHYLHLVHSIPHTAMNDIPELLYADFGDPLIVLYEGQAYYYLDQPERAWNRYACIEELRTTSIVPERIRLEIVNRQAEAALLLNDQERFCDCLKRGIAGAKAIQSGRRYQEVADLYAAARMIWTRDARIRALVDQFVGQ